MKKRPSDNLPAVQDPSGLPALRGKIGGSIARFAKRLTATVRVTVDPRANSSGVVPHAGGQEVMVLLDCSGSMVRHLAEAKSGVLDFARGSIDSGIPVGFIHFGSIAYLGCRPTLSPQRFTAALADAAAAGMTSMRQAIELGAEVLTAAGPDSSLIIATDGMPNDRDGTLQIAAIARDSGLSIFAIGTADADSAFLAELCGDGRNARNVGREDFAQAISDSTALVLVKDN